MVFGLGAKDSTNTPINTEKPIQEDLDEIKKIVDRLDSDEQVIVVAKQSRFKPGGSLITTPNIIFATNKRLILRNPTMLGLRENIEDYSYDKITNIKLEKGMFSSTLVITAPGMGTASRSSNLTGIIAWGRKEDGMIDAIPKDKAEQILKVVRNGMEEIRKTKMQSSVTVQTASIADELAKLAKLKEQGILTDIEFAKMKQDIIDKN
ncbi:MAG: PH domain-containing protein [Candidatus Nitrosotenuis sp.]